MIVPAHGPGHALPLAALHGEIDAAHDALQLRKLADHERREVGLGQPRRLPRHVVLGPGQESQVGAHRVDETRQPGHLVGVGAEALVERDAGQVGYALGQRPLAVFAVEERRVAQAGDHHPLHAPHHRVREPGVRVGDGREPGDRTRLAEGNVLLVVHEDGFQDLPGQSAELRRDAAHDHGRVLDEVAPLVHEAVVVLRRGARGRGEPLADPALPLRRVEDHEGLFQTRFEVGVGADAERTPGRSPRQEPVPEADIAAVDDRPPLRALLELVDRDRDDLPVEEGHQPADRPAEGERALAVFEPRVPAHPLRERERAQQRGDERGQHVERRPPRRLLHEDEVPLGRRRGVPGLLGQRLGSDPALAREALGRARPFPFRVARDLQRRPPDLLLAVLLAVEHVGPQHEPARRARAADLGRLQVLALGGLAETLRELLPEAGEPRRRHLLAADLEEELGSRGIRHAPRLLPRAPRSARRLRRPASGYRGSSPPAGSPRWRPAHRGR